MLLTRLRRSPVIWCACISALLGVAGRATATCVDIAYAGPNFLDARRITAQPTQVASFILTQTNAALVVGKSTETFSMQDGHLAASAWSPSATSGPLLNTMWTYEAGRLITKIERSNRVVTTRYGYDAAGRKATESVISVKDGVSTRVSDTTCTYAGPVVTERVSGKPRQGVRPVTTTLYTLDNNKRPIRVDMYDENFSGDGGPGQLASRMDIAYQADGASTYTLTDYASGDPLVTRTITYSASGWPQVGTTLDYGINGAVRFTYKTDAKGNWTSVQADATDEENVWQRIYTATRTITYKK